MLRLISILLDILSGLFAILAPIAVIHWIAGAFELQAIAGVAEFFSAIFWPFNTLVNTVAPNLPMIDYQGRQIPISQGIVAFLLTICFFSCAIAANLLRALDKKMTVTTDIIRSQHRMQQLESVRREQARQTIATNRILIYLIFPFDSQKNASTFFLGFKKYGGRQLPTRTEGMLIEFGDVQSAMGYARDTAEKLLAFYGTLRPMDPQPPFHMSIHAVRPDPEDTFPGLERCQLLIRYAGENQIIFSQQVLELLQVHSLTANYRYQTMGYYDFPSVPNQEVFMLFYKKPEQRVYY